MEEYIEHLNEKAKLLAQEILSSFDASIDEMKKHHASKGLLKSGNTIKFTMDKIQSSAKQYYSELLSGVKQSNLKFNPNIEADILGASSDEFDNLLNLLWKRLAQICALAGKPEIFPEMKQEVQSQVDLIFQRFANDIRHYVIELKQKDSQSTLSKFVGYVEIVVLVILAFLAGMWANDPSGNYEPFTVLLGILLTGLEVWRRKIT